MSRRVHPPGAVYRPLLALAYERGHVTAADVSRLAKVSKSEGSDRLSLYHRRQMLRRYRRGVYGPPHVGRALTLSDRVLRATRSIAKPTFNSKDIGDAVGIHHSRARKELGRLADRGLVTRMGPGRYISTNVYKVDGSRAHIRGDMFDLENAAFRRLERVTTAVRNDRTAAASGRSASSKTERGGRVGRSG